MLPMGNMFSRIREPNTNVIRNKRINSFLMPPKSHLDSLGLVQEVGSDRTARWSRSRLSVNIFCDTYNSRPVKVSALQHNDDSDHGLGRPSTLFEICNILYAAYRMHYIIWFIAHVLNLNWLKSFKAFMHDPNQHSKVVYDPDDFDKRTHFISQ